MVRRSAGRMWLSLVACLLALHTLPAHAEPSADAVKQARAVVEAQLKAFAADDADQAFSYAAPEIQSMFGTPGVFLAMVRSNYPMVYRPASVAFLAPTEAGGELVQLLQIADADGANWTAEYHLKRQPDGAWRITSCQVKSGSGRFI